MEKTHQAGSFLSPEQKKALTEIASADSTIIGKRARTILLINSGETHTEAVGKTGLTIGQVRYALVRFKKLGLSMFAQLPTTAEASEPSPKPVKTKKDKKKKEKTKKKEPKKKPVKKEGKKKKKGIKNDDSKTKKDKKKKKAKTVSNKKKKK